MGGSKSSKWVSDDILAHIFQYVHEASDRAAVSQVNKQWYRIEGVTRRSVSVKFIYAVRPECLTRRFRSLESVTIKGKPRVCDWELLGSQWGGYGDCWVQELVSSYCALRVIRFRRLDLRDESLVSLASAFHDSLEVLKLQKCSGFSSAGLHSVARHCKKLRVFCLEESNVSDAGDAWLRTLAQNESSELEMLNFSLTRLEVGSLEVVTALIRNCKALKSLKLGEVEADNEAISQARGILRAASLQEFLMHYSAAGYASISEHIDLPDTLTSLSGDVALSLGMELGSRLRKLDMMLCALEDCYSHLQVIKLCPNLEELKVRNVIGDEEIEGVARCCKRLRKIRIENLEEQHSFVSQKGLISLASSCVHLQSVAIYTSDLNNSALAAFGKYCPELYDFRIAVIDSPSPLSEFPLDSGVKGLLEGCRKLRKLALYLKLGGLSDKGLYEMGKLAENLEWLLLGCVGYSDAGFLGLVSGCHELRKLELRHCPFTEAGMAIGVNSMKKLNFLWCQGYHQIDTRHLVAMGPSWIVEYIPSVDEKATQFVAYQSLCGPRSDQSPEVIIFTEESLWTETNCGDLVSSSITI